MITSVSHIQSSQLTHYLYISYTYPSVMLYRYDECLRLPIDHILYMVSAAIDLLTADMLVLQ